MRLWYKAYINRIVFENGYKVVWCPGSARVGGNFCMGPHYVNIGAWLPYGARIENCVEYLKR